MSWIHILITAGIILGFIGLIILFGFLKAASDADEASNQAYRNDMRDMSIRMRQERDRYQVEQGNE